MQAFCSGGRCGIVCGAVSRADGDVDAGGNEVIGYGVWRSQGIMTIRIQY